MRYIIVMLAAGPLCTSCEKELDFHYHGVEPQLVIEGCVTEEGTSVALTRTTSMDEPMNPTKITDATVRLTDVTAGETKSLQPDASGIFTDATPGIVGHEYRIDVATGGQTYTSTSIMRPPSEICGVEFQWIKMPYDHVAVLQVSFTDPSSAGDYYWVRLYRNGEAYKWSVLDDSRAFDGIINEVLMTSRMDIDEEDDNTVLLDGDVVTVTVSAISREMADYLEALQSDSNGPCMFSGSFCLGYFLASPVAESEIVFRPDQMDVAG